MELRASYTIEAALIMPLLLSTLIVMLYTGFFLHDRVAAEAWSFTLAARYAGSEELTDKEIKKEILSGMERLEERLIATNKISTAVTVRDKEIKVSFEGQFFFPAIYPAGPMLIKRDRMIEVRHNVKRIRPAELIRGFRKAGEWFPEGGSENR